MSRTTEQFTLGNISNIWSNTARCREKKSLLDVNKENTVTSALWMITAIPYDVRKQKWMYRSNPENRRKPLMFTKAALFVQNYKTNCEILLQSPVFGVS